MTQSSILMVEDQSDIIDLVALHVGEIGMKLDSASDGEAGLKKALENSYDLIILDLQLPRLGGIEICKRIREENRRVPIIMLTSRAEEVNKVLGLEMGADDYLTKPFSVMELMARIKAVLRRTEEAGKGSAPDKMTFGELVIDVEYRRVTLAGVQIELTPREFELMLYLASNPGRPFTRQQIITGAWGYEYEGYEHTVSAHINRLRSKVEQDPENPRYILTVRGIGYTFTDKE